MNEAAILNAKILIIDDAEANLKLLEDLLAREGFHQVISTADSTRALDLFKAFQPDLILLDLMMPELDGYGVLLMLQRNKTTQHIPFIFITAKSLKEDKLKGYGLGADDYITKPFDEEELLWKIKAVIRRIPETRGGQKVEAIAIGNYTFDFNNQSLSIHGKTKRITEKESEIFHYLCMHKNQVIKREELLKELWGENDYFLGRSLDVFITKIRKYLKEDPDLSIENVFKVGFIFNVPEM